MSAIEEQSKRSKSKPRKEKEATLDDVDQWPVRASCYKLESAIGCGSYGLCWKAHCFDQSSPHHLSPVAIKVVSIAKFSAGNMDDLYREIQILSECHHQHVLGYYVSFVHEQELWLVMPYIEGGSLRNAINLAFPKGIKDEVLLASIFKQLVSGVQYFHKMGFVHRDLKGDNVLVHRDGRVLLSDFGVSTAIKTGKKEKEFAGSPCWMAPEVMEQKTGYDASADIWSLGITIIEIAEGKAPNEQYSGLKVLQSVLSSPAPEISRYESHWSPEFRAFAKDCLQKEPGFRPRTDKLLSKHSAFFAKARDAKYIAEHLVARLPAVKDRVDPKIVEQGQAYFDMKYQRYCRKQGIAFGMGKNAKNNSKAKIQWKFESVDLADTMEEETSMLHTEYTSGSEGIAPTSNKKELAGAKSFDIVDANQQSQSTVPTQQDRIRKFESQNNPDNYKLMHNQASADNELFKNLKKPKLREASLTAGPIREDHNQTQNDVSNGILNGLNQNYNNLSIDDYKHANTITNKDQQAMNDIKAPGEISISSDRNKRTLKNGLSQYNNSAKPIALNSIDLKRLESMKSKGSGGKASPRSPTMAERAGARPVRSPQESFGGNDRQHANLNGSQAQEKRYIAPGQNGSNGLGFSRQVKMNKDTHQYILHQSTQGNQQTEMTQSVKASPEIYKQPQLTPIEDKMRLTKLSEHQFTASEQQRILNQSRYSNKNQILNQSTRNNSMINQSILSNRIGEQHESKIHHEDDEELQNQDDLNSDEEV